MTDTGTAGTEERNARADAGGAEGRGMDASADFVRCATRSESTTGVVGGVGDGPMGSRGVAQAPMTDTGTEGTTKREVRAGACSADTHAHAASSASDADADMAAGMATDVTDDGSVVTTDGADDSEMAVGRV